MKCPQCGSWLIPCEDEEKRKWLKCPQCGAQFPLEKGREVKGGTK
jgi:DNA-directed RNA polymerase subunit M/transcription elongation factor TFIIS